MNINSVKILVAVADHRSFKSAADFLEMSLANVSTHISDLEQNLNQRLFDRSTRPPRLTSIGKELVMRSRELLVQWDALTENLGSEGHSGTLKLGTVHTAVAAGAARALGRLRRKVPGLFIQLQTALTPELIELIKSEHLDCAIVTRPPYPVIDTRYIEIVQENLAVIAHRDARGEHFDEVLRLNPYLRFNKKATLAQLIDGELGKRQITVQSTMEVTTLDAIESLVINGLGVSVVPVNRRARRLPKSVRILPFENPGIERNLGLLVLEDSPRMHLIATLAEELKRSFN